MFKITNKKSSGPPKMAKFLIIVMAPKEKTNLTCPFGKKMADCMPIISGIDDQGIITVIFPISISILNQTFFSELESEMRIELHQNVKTNSSIMNWKVKSFKSNEIKVQFAFLIPSLKKKSGSRLKCLLEKSQ